MKLKRQNEEEEEEEAGEMSDAAEVEEESASDLRIGVVGVRSFGGGGVGATEAGSSKPTPRRNSAHPRNDDNEEKEEIEGVNSLGVTSPTVEVDELS